MAVRSMHLKIISLFCLLCLSLSACAPSSTSSTSWKTSTPEGQGMDSALLAKMLADIRDNKREIHSVLVARNGVIILETYYPPFQADLPHELASMGKSVISMLAGIAIDQGKIKGLDQKMVDFYPDRTIANDDATKQSITLRDMLTMSAGLDWDEWRPNDARSSFFQLQHSPDPVQFILDRKMTDKPGERWNYSEGMFTLVSLIISQATQMGLPDFAQKYLFDPLGIQNVIWRPNPAGEYAVSLTPRDMAKLGLLMLKEGTWNGKRVISSGWVQDSTADHIQTGIDDQGYGYFWWRPPFGGYAADGDGGQRIYILPEKQIIVVITGGMTYPDMDHVPLNFMNTYILPAVKSAAPLPENKAAFEQMKELIQAAEQPKVTPAPDLPDTASAISGKTYTMKPNSIGLTDIVLYFKPEGAEIGLSFGGPAQKMAIGLDNTYRITQVKDLGPFNGWMAFRGAWINQNNFLTDFMFNGLARQLSFSFTGDRLTLYLLGSRGEVETIQGTVK